MNFYKIIKIKFIKKNKIVQVSSSSIQRIKLLNYLVALFFIKSRKPDSKKIEITSFFSISNSRPYSNVRIFLWNLGGIWNLLLKLKK